VLPRWNRRQKSARMIRAQRTPTHRTRRTASPPHEDQADADLLAFNRAQHSRHVGMTWGLQRLHVAVIE
jgi:hypothetical protein